MKRLLLIALLVALVVAGYLRLSRSEPGETGRAVLPAGGAGG